VTAAEQGVPGAPGRLFHSLWYLCTICASGSGRILVSDTSLLIEADRFCGGIAVTGQPYAQDAVPRRFSARLSAAVSSIVEFLTPGAVVLQVLTVYSTAVSGVDLARHSHWRATWISSAMNGLVFLPLAVFLLAFAVYYWRPRKLSRNQIWVVLAASVAGAAINITLLIGANNSDKPTTAITAIALTSCAVVIVRFSRWWLTLAFLELATAVLGIGAGGLDAISAPWLLAKILGIVLFVLGVLVVVGVAVFFRYFYSLSDNQKRTILLGSVAGTIIDIVLMLNAVHYSTAKLALFGLCAVPCVFCVGRFFRFDLIRPYLKTATAVGIASALLSFAPFLYNSIYLPSTADVPVELTFDSATSSQPRPGLDLMDVKITLEDMASTKAVVLTSMISVYGVSYNDLKANSSATPSQDQADDAGVGSTVPNLEFDGKRTRTLIALSQAINNGSFLPANLPFIRSIPVIVPVGKYQELDVEVFLRYARSDRLTLTDEYFGPQREDINGCSHDVRTAWSIAQTALGRLTHGNETAVADWCATVTSPQISSFIGGPPGGRTSRRIVRLQDAAYQVTRESDGWIVQLPAK
jgi:hypothetical protein